MNAEGIYFAGVPTAPDVQKLMDLSAGRTEGQIVNHDEIEATINSERSTDRFRTIVAAWKRRMFRERNVVLEAVKNQGYTILDPSRRVGHATWRVKQGVRRIRFGGTVARSTRREGLHDEEKRTLDHISNFDAALRLAEATSAKRLRLPDPVKAMA